MYLKLERVLTTIIFTIDSEKLGIGVKYTGETLPESLKSKNYKTCAL